MTQVIRSPAARNASMFFHELPLHTTNFIAEEIL